jgi:sugar diacid utilization regulator
MTQQESKIIITLAYNNLSAMRAARALSYHRNTVYYHVRKIRKRTGLNPYDFFDMQILYPMAQEVATQ